MREREPEYSGSPINPLGSKKNKKKPMLRHNIVKQHNAEDKEKLFKTSEREKNHQKGNKFD